MAVSPSLQTYTPGRRAAAYWFIDGLPDLAFGLAFLAVGIAGVIRGFDWSNRVLKWQLAIAWLILVLLFLRDRKILDFLKRRLTYPRTGYVQPPAELPSSPAPQIATLGTAAAPDENVSSFRFRTVFIFYLTMQFVGGFEGAAWTVPFFTAIAALVLYAWNREEPRPYTWWEVLPIAVAGLLSAAFDLPPKSRRFVPLIIGGLWLLALGGWTLIRYLRAHPRPELRERAPW